MVYDYLITLKNSDSRFADNVSFLMHIFALIYFGYILFTNPHNRFFFGIISVGIVLAWMWGMMKKKKNGQASFSVGLIIAALGWLLGGAYINNWMAILYLLAAFAEKQVKFPSEIGFSKEKISFNTFPKKILGWNEVNNVLLKDGLLTIDKKNNQLLQKEIDGEVAAEVENEFNQFCSSCISSSISG